MDVSQTVSDLLEDELSIRFLKLALSLNKAEKISTSSILHHHQEMFAAFKHLQKTDHIRMFYLF